MNNKKAKQLRQLAREQSVGLPYTKYKIGTPPQFIKDPVTQIYKRVTAGVPTQLTTCERKIYKNLKRTFA